MNEQGMKTKPANCKKHGDYETQVTVVLDREIAVGRCPKCLAEESAFEIERKERDKKNGLARRLDAIRIPARLRDATLETYRAASEDSTTALRVASNFARRWPSVSVTGAGLVFCGLPGTGKTHLACAIAKFVVNEFEATARYVTVLDALRRIKSTYKSDSDISEGEAVAEFTEPALLVLDEIGVQHGTDYEKALLFDILDKRYQELKPTIVISNLPRDELAQYVGQRVMDRVTDGGGAVVGFTWNSYRNRVA